MPKFAPGGALPADGVVDAGGSGALSTLVSSLNKAKAKTGAQPTNTGSPSGNNTIYNQQSFDTRIATLSYPMQDSSTKGQLHRGFMSWAQKRGGWGGFGGAVPTVVFLYNPTTVTASYALDISSSVITAQTYDSTGATVGSALNSTINFSLLFDRTFELWGSYDATGAPTASVTTASGTVIGQSGIQGSNDPAVIGVEADVLAFLQLAGMFFSDTGSTRSSQVQQLFQGPMLLTPTYLNFGSIASGMTYYGFLSDFTVTYTHWTQSMVPMRCTISVDFTLLFPPGTAQLKSSGGNSFTALQAANQVSSTPWSNQDLGQYQYNPNPGTGNQGTNPAGSSGTSGR